ncbi:MAG: septum formation protein Maf [Lachnospiraceae bacterium]|nr:septum formation protein Maf [Lachnospiraceae bacterium]
MNTTDTIILASNSPRRRELMAQVRLEYEVIPSEVEEIVTKTIPSDVVLELSEQKCIDVAKGVIRNLPTQEYDVIVIGADTVVANDNRIYGKPANEDDAKRMLSDLRGHSHSVFTGVTFAKVHDKEIVETRSFYEETLVYMLDYSDDIIDMYVASGEPLDKAGAYGIQGLGAILVDRIEGDYNNVVGLPISKVYHELLTF